VLPGGDPTAFDEQHKLREVDEHVECDQLLLEQIGCVQKVVKEIGDGIPAPIQLALRRAWAIGHYRRPTLLQRRRRPATA